MNDERIYGLLSDIDIKKYFDDEIKIYTEYKEGEFSFNLDKQLQLASIDLRFRNDCKRFKKGLNRNLSYEMLKNHEYTEPFEVSNSERLIIAPGEIILTTTLETIMISNNFAGIITGRSSIARLGIMVHCCQEFINPGQGAPLALQITNLGKNPVELDMRVPICQLILFKLSSPSSNSYSQMTSSKYKDENKPMSSKIYEDSTHLTDEIVSERKLEVLRRFLKKYISPFLPAVIMTLLITPQLVNLQNTSLLSLFSGIQKMPIAAILAAVAVVLYIYLRKDEDK